MNCNSRLLVALVLVTAIARDAGATELEGPEASRGAKLYAEQCAVCHGKAGEGAKGGYEKPLVGDRSVAQLANYLEERMPEDEPELLVGDDAREVAKFIHAAFYSPIARARSRPPRIELARLTVRQYRNVIADLLAPKSPRSVPPETKHGLSAEFPP